MDLIFAREIHCSWPAKACSRTRLRRSDSPLLCTAFRDSVLCIGEYRTPSPPRRLKAIYPRHSTEIENAGLGGAHGVFRKTLNGIKKGGYLLTRGELNPASTGSQHAFSPIRKPPWAVWRSRGMKTYGATSRSGTRSARR